MKKKTIIHEFDPVIYPVKLWVCITTNFEPLKERFYDSEGKTELDLEDLKDAAAAITCRVVSKEHNDVGILIVFTLHKYTDTERITHEAAHAVDFVWEYIKEDTPSPEANAYLSGWIAKCCWEVKTGKGMKHHD